MHVCSFGSPNDECPSKNLEMMDKNWKKIVPFVNASLERGRYLNDAMLSSDNVNISIHAINLY